MKKIKINDAFGDKVEVVTYEDSFRVYLTAIEGHGDDDEDTVNLALTWKQSKQLRKALKKAEKEISS